ncbi:MAG: hypothetical protein ACXAEF_03685 [Candidatus Thorarchaeota archaeon]
MKASFNNAIDDEYPHVDYNRQAKSNCSKTIVYCAVSLALLILAGGLGNPTFVATLPGGAATASILSIGIVIGVFILCMWQMPRKPSLSKI